MKKLLLLFVVMLLPLLASAYDFTVDGIYYNLKNDGNLEVKGLASWTTVADIPSSLTISGTKYRVTSIGARAFEGRSDMTYLSIPYSIKSIGEYAFSSCGSSITVNIADPESWCQMQIENYHASPLSSAGKMLVRDIETTSFTVPETVTSIGAFTFYQCSCIKSLYVPSSVTSIGSSAFEDCDYLTSVTLSEGLQSIGGSAFEGCNRLSTLTIPSTVNTILINAFKNCVSLTDVFCKAVSVPNTDASAFNGVFFENITLHVPANSVNAYRATWPWSNFKEIIGTSSGVVDPANQYLTFVAKESGKFSFSGTSSNTIDNSVIYYSLDDGYSWSPLVRNAQSPTIQAGKKIMFKGTCTPFYYYVEGADAIVGIGVFSSTGLFDAEGNIMSILYGDSFIGKTDLIGKNFAFFDLFSNCTGLVSARNLILPAKTLADNCYDGMFRNCSSLTTAPQLPATTLANSCYEGMFYACTSLTTAPQLPAISLGESCYCYMFGNCTSLTTAPQLPATTLTDMCYRYMFNGCSSLTAVPQLPAATLTTKCYEYMFDGCTNLRDITCLATNISASECTKNWVRNVPQSGTFTKSSSMKSWSIGVDGIPANWTIQNINEPSTPENPEIPVEADFSVDGIYYHISKEDYDKLKVVYVDKGMRAVEVPELVTYNGSTYFVGKIGDGAFQDNSTIETIVLPSSITSIGMYAFGACSNLKSITIPNSVEEIGDAAFYGCERLESIAIPDGVTILGDNLFWGCARLTDVTIPTSVTIISKEVFRECLTIGSITIPSYVTEIGENAFQKCFKLTDVYCYAESVPNTDYTVFDGMPTEKAVLHVPANSVEAYKATWPWREFKEIVPLTDKDITGIIAVKQADDRNGEYYDLTGRRVHQPQKGLYIRNGKKAIVK